MASRPAARKRPARDPSGRRIRALERALAQLVLDDAPEAALRQRAELVLAQVADLGVAVLVANDTARYVDANVAATILTGYTRSELLRMSVWDLTPAPRRGLGQRFWRDFLQRRRMRGRYQIKRKDGTVVTTRYTAVAHVLPGIHISAMSAPALVAELAARARAARRRRREGRPM